jgi:transketolase
MSSMQLSREHRTTEMRTAYGEALVELGKKNPDIVCVGADTTDSVKTKRFGDLFPERMFNVGIAEANLVSIAAGLAIAGKISFASTYAAFLPGRCLDQIRNAICYPNLNVKLVVSHAGLTVGPDGASHQQIEDISAMRTIPNMHVIVPCDSTSVKKIVPLIAYLTGPFYIRLARPASMIIYEEDESDFNIGHGNKLRDGSDGTIISCGLMVQQSLEAAKILKQEYDLSCRIVDMYSIKPIDSELIIECARETGFILTAEEHNIIGGLGSAITEVTSENYPIPVRRLGVRDTFGESARDNEINILLEKYGLSVSNIVKTFIKLRAENHRE